MTSCRTRSTGFLGALIRGAALGVLALLLALPTALEAAADAEVEIGVLSFRSKEKTLERWQPTADYLSAAVPGYTFRFLPMFYPELEKAAEEGSVDFILTNSGHYVTLTVHHGIVRMATLVKSVQGKAVDRFGGVIFTRADRADLNDLGDLRGKTFMGVGKLSLGGFLVAWERLLRAGIDPFKDFARVTFNGMPHDRVVERVLAGEADAGTVRTSILESMAREGRLDLADVRILGKGEDPNFPFLYSTQLYPEWPLSAARGTRSDLAKAVLAALLAIPVDHAAARAGKYVEWTVPADYSPVRKMMERLRTGPFERPDRFDLRDVLSKYQEYVIGVSVLSLLLVLAVAARLLVLNRALERAGGELERRVEERTAELALSESRLSEAQRVARIGNWEWNIETDALWWSDQIYRVFGLEPQVFGATLEAFLETVHPDDRETVNAAVQHALNTGGSYAVDHRIVLPDGLERIVHEQGEVVLDAAGNPVRMIGTVQDITEQRLAERALRENEEKYRKLFDNAIDAVCIFDRETHRLIDVNDAYVRMYGYSREEALELTTEDISAEPEQTREVIEKAQESGDLLVPIRKHRKKDGTVVQVEISAGPFTWKGRDVMFAIARDITQRMLSEEALKESEGRYKSLAEMSPEAIVVHNYSRVIYANQTALDLFAGGDPKLLIDKPILELIHPESLEVVKKRIQQQVKRPGTSEFIEERLMRHDGSSFLAEVGGHSVHWYGQPGIQLVIRDITERKEAEEALRQSNLDLQQFAYVASHDLREPLRMVTSYLQLLDRKYQEVLDETAREFIGFAVDGAKRMDALIRDLLQYSRVQTHGETFATVDSEEVLQEALDNLRASLDETDGVVTYENLPRVSADRSQLLQLFQNLVGNALKYRDGDRVPEIQLAAKVAGGSATFSVQDNSIGIDPEYFERIFVIFQRLHGRNEYKGTGIGLAVCKRIVERHGGRIWVESEPGKGSVFFFTLPTAAE